MVDIVKFTIIITTYNYEKYIEECILSCLNQNTNNFDYEVIIIDDGSTDNTEKIIKKFKNEKIKYFKTNNYGIERASNLGILKSNGDYIVRVDADDVLSINYLNTLNSQIDKKYDFYYPNYSTIDKNSEIINVVKLPEFSIKEILCRGDFLATGTLFNKSIFNRIGLYNEKNKNCGLENYELILKLVLSGSKGRLINENLFFYRRHSENISSQKRKKIIEYGRTLFNNFLIGKYETNKFHPYNLKI